VKLSQYLRAAASLSSALDSEVFRTVPLGATLLEHWKFLETHRDHVAFVHNSGLCCTTIFVLHRFVDRFVAGAHHKSENTVTICEIRVQEPSRLSGRTGIVGPPYCETLSPTRLAGSTPTLPRKENGARVWGTKAKPLAAYRWRLCCSEFQLFVRAAPCRFHGRKCETADRAQTIRWFMGKESKT